MSGGAESPPDVAVDDGRLPGWLATYLTGLAMGSADAVPGVSGGTIALIAGIYDRLVGAIAAFDPGQLADALERRSAGPLVDLFVEMDAPFLIALGAGAVTGVVTIAQVLEFAYVTYPGPTFAFFFGVIGASALVLFGEVSVSTRRQRVAALAGLVVGVLASGEFSAVVGQSPVVVLVAGAFSICAMILPGLSGAFILLVLGLHEFLAHRLNDFVESLAALATGGSVDAVVAPATYVFAYGIGAVVGLLTFARVVEAALERDRASTLTFLIALMVGALRLPLRRVMDALFETLALVTAQIGPLPVPTGVAVAGPPTAVEVAVVVVATIVGGALVVALEWTTGGIGYDGEEPAA